MTETILALREEKDADWPAKLEKNLQANQISLSQLEVSYMVLIIQFKTDSILKPDAHLVRKFLQVIQDEIERRRESGEVGIYKKSA